MMKVSGDELKGELINLNIKVMLSYGKALIAPSDVRAYLKSKGYTYKKQIISFQMLKGGVAKTTSCLNIGLRAAMYGHRVLFMDLDQQANLSLALGVDDLKIPVFLDVLEKKKTLSDVIIKLSSHVSLVPSNLNNSVIERVLLNSYRNISNAVKKQIETVLNDYDLVVIDTAPSLSMLNTSVTCASDKIILPVNPDKFTVYGMQKHLLDLDQVKKDFDLDFQEKILFTKFDGRESASQSFLDQCFDICGDKMLDQYIRTSSDVKNSISPQKTIFDSVGNGKEDYDMVSREILGLFA